jgi:hypothetical protein
MTVSREISSIICRETSLVVLVHTSTTLLYFSVRVMMPSRYWPSMSSTSCWAAWMRAGFLSGILRSFTPMVMPARVAYSYPRLFSLSQRMTVALVPAVR